jgi:hypothetical protein
MATTSQKMMEMRFFVRIRGAFTPPPRIDVPVMNMPLVWSQQACHHLKGDSAYHAAPTTDSPMQKAIPVAAQV